VSPLSIHALPFMKSEETNTNLCMDRLHAEILKDTIAAHSCWGGGLSSYFRRDQ